MVYNLLLFKDNLFRNKSELIRNEPCTGIGQNRRYINDGYLYTRIRPLFIAFGLFTMAFSNPPSPLKLVLFACAAWLLYGVVKLIRHRRFYKDLVRLHIRSNRSSITIYSSQALIHPKA